jgi:hypothetical protein
MDRIKAFIGNLLFPHRVIVWQTIWRNDPSQANKAKGVFGYMTRFPWLGVMCEIDEKDRRILHLDYMFIKRPRKNG